MRAKPLQSHRELVIWQRSVQLSVALYKLTRSFPREELYGLTNQLRRAGVSIPSNIAEGYGRLTREQYRHFLGIAQGSNLEIQTQLEIARELQFAEPPQIEKVEALSFEVGRMLTALLKRLRPLS
jgi:four helix bundle protein